MGYYVQTRGVSLAFKPGTDLAAVLKHVHETMFTPEAVAKYGSGGSYYGGRKVESWYAWVDTDAALACTSIDELIGLFVDEFEWLDTPEDLDFRISMDSKSGQEDLLFKHLAPFISAGSFVEWRGEDDALWCWVFDGTSMHTKNGEVVYH